MGLHTGTPTVAAEGYVGIDVHPRAGVAALAHGGQVILSATTAALVADEPLLDLGRHRLKDFDGPAQLFQRSAPASFPRFARRGAVDLPTPATQFLGRERELFDAATTWLERDPRLLTIVGPGGTGKTRFSIELARFLADKADAGTVFVPLAPVRDAALVVPLVAAALGASDDSVNSVATRLGDKQAHVVLDNLEQLLPDAARPVAELLAAAASLRIVATSREPLRIAGEVEIDLPPMVEADAVTLFLQRAQAIRADIGDSPAIHELIERLDGLPLAIELAAARVKLLGPDQLLERIGQRLDLLKGGRDADERHATLRATIAWSYDLLGAESSSFSPGSRSSAAARPSRTLRRSAAPTSTLSASLLDKSLVRRRTDPDGEERFWMLETIREFARERLDASGEENELRREQCDRLIALADRAGTRAVVKGPLPWRFDLIAPEIDNVRAVLEWSLDRDPSLGLRLATLLEAFWVVRDAVEGAGWLERLLERAPDAEPTLRAQALRALGGASDILGDADRSPPFYRESLELFTEAGEELEAAHMRFRIAANMVMRGEWETAWPLLEASLSEARRLGHTIGECQALGFLSDKAHREGDVEQAIVLALESAAIAAALDWAWWEAGQVGDVAEMERELGRLDDAERHAQRSLDLSHGLGDRRQMIFAGAELAIIATYRGDAARAGLLWGAVEAEASSRRVGQWERARGDLEALVQGVDGPAFSAARAEGSLLSIAEAAQPGLPGS